MIILNRETTNTLLLTLNPHYKNYSFKTLIDDFNYCLKQYYRNKIGRKYYNHKDKQFLLALVPEDTKNVYPEPHLHIMIRDVPDCEINSFPEFIYKAMQRKYFQITYDCKVIPHLKNDEVHAWQYILKEDKGLFTSQDLCDKSYLDYTFPKDLNRLKYT